MIYAVKPGDGSAREQAASCQKVLGGFANIAKEYATKRYRSNLINWGMLPFIYDEDELPSVSYTHLDFHKALDNPILVHPEDNWMSYGNTGDVKRNLIHHEEDEHGDVNAVFNDCEEIIAVSYTHLSVSL